MTMTTDDKQRGAAGPDLTGFFDAARAVPPTVPPGMADRMVANAARARAEATGRTAARRARGPGWLGQLGAVLGGWYGAGGLAAACAAGVWIGLAPPSGLPDPGALWSDATTAWDVYETGGFLSAAAEEG